jgi:hypothetical protein
MNIFKDWGKQEVYTMVVALSDYSTDLTIGTKESFLVPCDMLIKNVTASVNTAPTGTTSIIADIHIDGNTMFITRPEISLTKTTTIASGMSVKFVYDILKKNQVAEFIIDQVGDTTAGKGLRLYIDYIKL